MILFWLSCVPVTLLFAWVAGFGSLTVVRSLRQQGSNAWLVIFWSFLLILAYYLSFTQFSWAPLAPASFPTSPSPSLSPSSLLSQQPPPQSLPSSAVPSPLKNSSSCSFPYSFSFHPWSLHRVAPHLALVPLTRSFPKGLPTSSSSSSSSPSSHAPRSPSSSSPPPIWVDNWVAIYSAATSHTISLVLGFLVIKGTVAYADKKRLPPAGKEGLLMLVEFVMNGKFFSGCFLWFRYFYLASALQLYETMPYPEAISLAISHTLAFSIGCFLFHDHLRRNLEKKPDFEVFLHYLTFAFLLPASRIAWQLFCNWNGYEDYLNSNVLQLSVTISLLTLLCTPSKQFLRYFFLPTISGLASGFLIHFNSQSTPASASPSSVVEDVKPEMSTPVQSDSATLPTSQQVSQSSWLMSFASDPSTPLRLIFLVTSLIVLAMQASKRSESMEPSASGNTPARLSRSSTPNGSRTPTPLNLNLCHVDERACDVTMGRSRVRSRSLERIARSDAVSEVSNRSKTGHLRASSDGLKQYTSVRRSQCTAAPLRTDPVKSPLTSSSCSSKPIPPKEGHDLPSFPSGWYSLLPVADVPQPNSGVDGVVVAALGTRFVVSKELCYEDAVEDTCMSSSSSSPLSRNRSSFSSSTATGTFSPSSSPSSPSASSSRRGSAELSGSRRPSSTSSRSRSPSPPPPGLTEIRVKELKQGIDAKTGPTQTNSFSSSGSSSSLSSSCSSLSSQKTRWLKTKVWAGMVCVFYEAPGDRCDHDELCYERPLEPPPPVPEIEGGEFFKMSEREWEEREGHVSDFAFKALDWMRQSVSHRALLIPIFGRFFYLRHHTTWSVDSGGAAARPDDDGSETMPPCSEDSLDSSDKGTKKKKKKGNECNSRTSTFEDWARLHCIFSEIPFQEQFVNRVTFSGPGGLVVCRLVTPFGTLVLIRTCTPLGGTQLPPGKDGSAAASSPTTRTCTRSNTASTKNESECERKDACESNNCNTSSISSTEWDEWDEPLASGVRLTETWYVHRSLTPLLAWYAVTEATAAFSEDIGRKMRERRGGVAGEGVTAMAVGAPPAKEYPGLADHGPAIMEREKKEAMARQFRVWYRSLF